MVKRVAKPAAFYNPDTEIRRMVHGDDFVLLAWEGDLEETAQNLREDYQLKFRGIVEGASRAMSRRPRS